MTSSRLRRKVITTEVRAGRQLMTTETQIELRGTIGSRGSKSETGLDRPGCRRHRGDTTMTTEALESLVPSAKAVMQKIAAVEAEKATVAIRAHAQQEAEKKALIDRLSKPSGLSDEEVMK